MYKHISQEAFIAWAAGFFDGEGCVTVVTERLRVMVSQVDLAPLELFQAYWGGSIGLNTSSGCSNWTLHAGKAVNFLEDILPFLVVKESVARLGIAIQETVVGQGQRPTSAQFTLRRKLMAQLKQINSPRAGKGHQHLMRVS